MLKALKKFSQNFLQSTVFQKQIADCINPSQHHILLEIGPGTGCLTQHLLNKKYHQLILIEYDQRCIEHLTEHFMHHDNLQIHHADILAFQWSHLPPAPLYIVGSLPYHITSPILLHILNAPHLEEALLIVQKEVGQRLIAQTHSKNYGRLSIILQLQAQIDYLFDIPPEAFSPEPKVTSCLVRITKKQHTPSLQELQSLGRLTNLCFQQRRKQLKNTLKGTYPNISDILNELAIPAQARPETITPEMFLVLSKKLNNFSG